MHGETVKLTATLLSIVTFHDGMSLFFVDVYHHFQGSYFHLKEEGSRFLPNDSAHLLNYTATRLRKP